MSFGVGSKAARQSVYQETPFDASQRPSTDCLASGSQDLLARVLKVGREWLDRLSVDDPQRGNHTRLGMLVEDLIKGGEPSSLAMSNVRALLCASCRRLDAAQGKCSGQALDRCLLLKRAGS